MAHIRLVSCALLAGVLSALFFFSRRTHPGHADDVCSTPEYRGNVLKLVKEAPFAGLFGDLKNQTKFEASGVAFDESTSTFLTVFDSSMSIGRMDETFRFRGKSNVLIGEREKESQFEGVSLYSGKDNTWLLLAEAVPRKGGWYPEITLARLPTPGKLDSYDILETCLVDFRLSHENKGFESIIYVPEHALLLGLCEGNHCSGGKKGREKGNGRIVVSRLDRRDESCVWNVVDTLEIPSSASFQDYSAMAIHRGMGKMAILSQEDAAVALLDFDVNTLQFGGEQDGIVWHLPRNAHCDIVFCNAEGIAFMDEYRLLIVSDKAKSRQGVECVPHDQSAAIFVVPSGFEPYVR